MTPVRGNVVEVFSSIQGEGLFVGCRQVFVRLAGCAYGCRYCDQPEARRDPDRARIEQGPGTGQFREMPNPVADRDLVRYATALDTPGGLHQAFSVTGGEPLEQAPFLEAALPALAASSPDVVLETNGTDVSALMRVIEWVDCVAMDWKLASATGRSTPWQEHRQFLSAARSKRVFVKAVVAEGTVEDEVVRLAEAMAEEDPTIPLVLQPVTEVRGGPKAPTGEQILRLQAAARGLRDVRVIGQMHRLMGLR